MFIRKLCDKIEIKAWIDKIGVQSGGKEILGSKMQQHFFYIQDLHVAAANILKQDALSIGADLAVPKSTILCEEPYVDAILIGSEKHMQILSKKELAQPFGLKDLAKELRLFLSKPTEKSCKIMGVINANEDSFYKESRFKHGMAIKKIESMIEDGADIIDIGGVSSKPGSSYVGSDEELKRVKPIIDAIYSQKLYEKISFSLDSYAPMVVEYALDKGFRIINDITGLSDNKVCELIGKYEAKAVIMHMQGTPDIMQNRPEYSNLFQDIQSFFTERIEKAHRYNIKDIVLDVGIGFGKSLEDNLALIHNLSHFKRFNKEILIGASRKSMIDSIYSSKIKDRLPGTLAIHLKAYENGASIIRCHDVKEHKQALSVHKAIMQEML